MTPQAILVAGIRTPITTSGPRARHQHAYELGAHVVRYLYAQCLDLGQQPDAVVLGNCRGPGGNVARSAALAAGLPVTTPAATVDLQCGSGQYAIHVAADMVRSGAANLVIAGGFESATHNAPTAMSRAPFAPDGFADPDMGAAADDLAAHEHTSRIHLDQYALRSWQLTASAQEQGWLAAECLPGDQTDDRPRHMTARTLAALRPAFAVDGTSTAANSCGLADGAAAVVVASSTYARMWQLPQLVMRSTALVADDPALPGRCAGPAITAACRLADVPAERLARLDVNEAFAAQVLSTARHIGWATTDADGALVVDDRLNPEGGAIALGHPWAASGAITAVRLLHAAQAGRVGLDQHVAMACAIGGGQGIAAVAQVGKP